MAIFDSAVPVTNAPRIHETLDGDDDVLGLLSKPVDELEFEAVERPKVSQAR